MSDYEKEIDKMMDILKDYPETLRKMLINYDKLEKRSAVKQTCLFRIGVMDSVEVKV